MTVSDWVPPEPGAQGWNVPLDEKLIELVAGVNATEEVVNEGRLSVEGLNSTYAPLEVASRVLQGSGAPNGVVTATVGTLYVDTAKTLGVSVWRKDSGTGNTGWVVSVGSVSRSITAANLLNGWTFGTTTSLRLSRDSNIVTVSIPALGFNGRAATANQFFELPSGFRTDLVGNFCYIGDLFNADGTARVTVQKSFNFLESTARVQMHGILQWRTSDPWPTTLPGTPA